MKLTAIRNERDYALALQRIEALWQAEPDSAEASELDRLAEWVEAYENQHYPLEPGDPIELIRFKLRELGWSQNRLAKAIGISSGRISEILNRKRDLTLKMIPGLCKALDLRPNALIPTQGVEAELAAGVKGESRRIDSMARARMVSPLDEGLVTRLLLGHRGRILDEEMSLSLESIQHLNPVSGHGWRPGLIGRAGRGQETGSGKAGDEAEHERPNASMWVMT